MKRIRILLADDHLVVRKGVVSLLRDEPDMEVIAETETGRDTIQLTDELRPDVVMLDLAMPDLNGLEVLRQIKKRVPGIRVIMLTIYVDEEYVFQALRAGALGYIAKQAAPEELLDAIHTVCADNVFVGPSAGGTAILARYTQHLEASRDEIDRYDTLTEREREVLLWLAQGHSNQEIATGLSISIKTIETHRAKLMSKLQLSNLVELVKYAIRKGIVTSNQ